MADQSSFPPHDSLKLFVIGLLTLACVPARAQEAPANVNNSQPAAVHQWGILRSGPAVNESALLPLPNFVHRSEIETTTHSLWLDFSAVYIIPPQMTTEHLTLQVNQGLTTGGLISAWYPYAADTSTLHARRWTDVFAGVMADPLKTESNVWMPPRAMEAAAPLKVYKPGPTGSKPDDNGTTEGDVFIFMRGAAGRPAPLSFLSVANAGEWEILPTPGSCIPATSNTIYAWVAGVEVDTLKSRRIRLAAADGKILVTRTRAILDEAPYSSGSLDLRIQLNEALVGNGLRPDEASAQSDLVIQVLQQLKHPALIYLVPQQWTDQVIPLTVQGPALKPVRVFLGIAQLQDP